MNPRIFILFFLIFLIFLGLANIIEAAPPRYTDHFDGTITDNTTGLMWMRCAMGQTWADTTCSGNANKYSLTQAKTLTSDFAGHNDWRLPNIRELQTIVDRTLDSPAIDGTAFSATPLSSFWSSSPYSADANYGWYVSFYYGYASYGNQLSAPPPPRFAA